jgi:hypothetical protein
MNLTWKALLYYYSNERSPAESRPGAADGTRRWKRDPLNVQIQMATEL